MNTADQTAPAEVCRCGFDPCKIHVSCDDNCGALTNPQTVEELRAALVHWRDHDHLSGCSHGN